MRLLVALLGVSFSVTLMLTQLSIYLGASRTITTIIDHSDADLWVMPAGTRSFEDGLPLLTGSERQMALATAGVKTISAIASSFADWQEPTGTIDSIVLIGSDPQQGGPKPTLTENFPNFYGSRDVIVDRDYAEKLGIRKIGDRAAIERLSVRVSGFSSGMRSFTQSPYVFTSPAEARKYLNLPSDLSTFLLIKVHALGGLQEIQESLSRRLQNEDVLTTAEFRNRSLETWLMNTGAGQALIVGTILGAVVGVAVMMQTIIESLQDHQSEFALLRCIGCRAWYTQSVIAVQAISLSVSGLILGFALFAVAKALNDDSALDLALNVSLALAVCLLTVIMGLISSLAAIEQLRRIDPLLCMQH